MTKIIGDLIKVWGIKQVLKEIASQLKKYGGNEKQLAAEIEDSIDRYEARK